MFTWRQIAAGFGLLGMGYLFIPPLSVMSRGATVLVGVGCWAVFMAIVAFFATRPENAQPRGEK